MSTDALKDIAALFFLLVITVIVVHKYMQSLMPEEVEDS